MFCINGDDYENARKRAALAGLVYLTWALIFNLIGYFASPYVIIAVPFVCTTMVAYVYHINKPYRLARWDFIFRLFFFEFITEAMILATFLYYTIALRDVANDLNSVATLYTSAFPQKFIVMFWFAFSSAYVTAILLLGVPCLAPPSGLKPSESQQKLNEI